MSLLVIDLGNTRLKWGWQDTAGLLVGEPVVHRDTDLGELLKGTWTFPVAPARVLMTNVANAALADQLTQWLKKQWNISPELIGSSAQLGEVKNSYSNPEQLGSDRWVAMLEAWYMAQSTVCVIDCGTAVTIDVVDQSGQHLGGVIMPGFEAMLTALTSTTSLVLDKPQVPATFELAKNTQAAIATGTSQSIISLVNKTLEWLKQETGESAECFLTGGDSARLSSLLEHSHIVDNDLVIKGLVRIANGF
jgi:type III pantothenate kinase